MAYKAPDIDDREALGAAAAGSSSGSSVAEQTVIVKKPVWYRSTWFNAMVLGMCNFLAPGLWGALNSLGGGGEEKPYLVNAANALTFGLMVVTCCFSSVVVKYIGIKATLILGTIGYAPYAAGLYTNNRYGNEWFVLLGSAITGVFAGLFWMSEAAIALAYPEPHNQGRFLGFWLSFKLAGQIVGGAINLGLNADRSSAGKVTYNVYFVFIALQSLAPFCGLLLSRPKNVQRTDGLQVKLAVSDSIWHELKATAKLFCSRNFLLLVPLICQAVYTEAVDFTYETLWFSVRARALGSFLSAVVAIIFGNLLGLWLDNVRVALKTRARSSFIVILGLRGAWFIWATVLVTRFRQTQPNYDWVDQGFGNAFALFLFLIIDFQLNYLYLYFLIGLIAKDEPEVIRAAGLLRATESASQAVSYGLNSIPIFGQVGGFYLNFGLWAVALLPAWMVVKDIGGRLGDKKVDREASVDQTSAGKGDSL